MELIREKIVRDFIRFLLNLYSFINC